MKQDKNKNKNEHMSIQHFIYTHFLELFDTFKEEKIDENICQKALNVLCQSKISNKYKLILPLFKDFDIQNGEVVINGLIEEPVWLYDSSDPILLDRVRIHTRLQKGITDTYCKTDLGSSILIMESGTNQNLQKICVTIESSKDLTYKMGLDKSESANFLVSQAKDDKKTISTDLEQIDLLDIHIEIRNKLKEQKIKENNELCDGIRAHYPFLVGNRYIVYYFFPNNIENFSVQNNITNKYKRVGNGGVFVVSNQKLGGKEKSFFLSLAYLLGNKLAIKRSNIRLKKESLKSAKAAIMSRNMSHNLGSHVMFYIKQKLQSVSKIIDNKVLANIIPGELSDLKTIEQKIKENKDVELPFLVGLGRFINYLQERQDYIATVATDYIPARSTISFKDFIYDELKPDLRYERHYSQNNDAGWKSGNLLLDYIAYSEGYRSCDKIEILFGDFDGHKPKEDSSPDKDFQKLREFNIAVPGGVIGRQALFSIFENIIRNAAKHSERRDDNKLVLQLSLLSKDNNLFKSDNFKCIRNDGNAKYVASGNILREKYKECFDKYHVLRIKIDMPNDSSTVKNLVTKLADSYIEDGHMNENSKGLKEMRISAAWLRGYSIDTEIPANDPPALSIYTEPYSEDNSKVTISYILCIPRPCRVAFIDSNNATDAQNKILAPYGCKVFPDPFKLKNEEDKEEDREKLIDEIANYEIVCMLANLEEQLCPYISSRYIIDDNQSKTLLKNLIDSIGKTDYDAIEDSIGSVYETWFKTTDNDTTPTLVVADSKAVRNNKKESGSLSNDNNIILTTTGKITDEDNASNQNFENVNDVSGILSERIVTQNDVKGAVVYSTHFKGLTSKSEGPDGYNTWFQDAICIESVTGNNSTARLIRQDKWTKEWKTKILSASMAKVAIFDERIFSSFISCESKAREDGLSVETIKQIKNDCRGDEERFQKALDNFAIPLHISETLFYANENDNPYAILEEFLAQYSHDVAQKNHERRIWAFDIRVPEDINNRVEIVGYNVLIGDRVGAYIEHKKDAIITIANISRHSESGQYDIVLCEDKTVFEDGKTNIFDYISIHQGVLDKIYTAFGVKEVKMEKCKITNALHHCFSKHITPEDKEAFLPNFIIHSGRSKPSAADMPQHQPFVQFAAVDHAVKDCKYTLVELLATAHYEKDNNNN